MVRVAPFFDSRCIFGRAAITLGIGPHSSFIQGGIGTRVNKYIELKYKYKCKNLDLKYKYFKHVLEYNSSASTSTKYTSLMKNASHFVLRVLNNKNTRNMLFKLQ